MAKKKTKTILRITLIVAAISSLYFVPWLLVKAWITPLPNTVQEQVDEAISYGFDGMIVYIKQGDKTPQQYTGGWHNKATKTLPKPNALFKIASISKLYDAVAVTKLVNAKRLSLNKTLADYLPELLGKIEYADKITLKLLLQHKSGIPNFTDVPDFWAAPTQTYEESLALILNQKANFAPGEDYEYCNTNYLLLNKIMDNELGYGNFKFIKQEILTPLKLNNTYGTLSEVNMDDVMSGYHVGHPYDLKADDHGMLATAKDVATFVEALNKGTLFTPQEQKNYVYEYEHAGWVPGYQSFAAYHKEIDVTIVVFYSTTDPKLYNWNLAEIINTRIVDILKSKQAS